MNIAIDNGRSSVQVQIAKDPPREEGFFGVVPRCVACSVAVVSLLAPTPACVRVVHFPTTKEGSDKYFSKAHAVGQ
jgi:hypothetical protein